MRDSSHTSNPLSTIFLTVSSTSDLYNLAHGCLEMNQNRMFGSTPVIKLGDHFKKVANYQKRFKSIPNLLELDHLTVSGDVTFGRKVTLRGTVIIVANEGQKIDIADGSILENSKSPDTKNFRQTLIFSSCRKNWFLEIFQSSTTKHDNISCKTKFLQAV